MKKLLFLICFLIPTFIFAQVQDWDISPLQQKTFFSSPDGQIKLHYVDSIDVFPNYRKHYFGAKYLTQVFETCYDEILNSIPPYELTEQPIEIWYSNDSNFYFLSNTVTIRLYHKSPIGFSWIIPNYSTNNDYNQIQFNCTAIEEFSFLGITDSVRVFELQTLQDGISVSNDLNDTVIRLSKNHGFIEQFFLPNLISASNLNPVLQKIEGINTTNTSVGFDFQFENMMQNFAAGDVYKWKSSGLGFFPDDAHVEWFRDSFLQVTHYPDSIVIYLNSEYALFPAGSSLYSDTLYQYSQNAKKVITKSSFGNLFSTPNNYIFSGFNHLDWYSTFKNLNIENGIFNFQIDEYTFTYDSMDCELNQFIGTTQTFSYNSKVGLYYIYAPGFVGGREKVMVGYIQGNEMVGDYSPVYQLLTPTDNLKTANIEFEIFPNPSTDFLFFEIKNQQSNCIEIYNVLGEIVFQKKVLASSNKLDISFLPVGSYAFVIKNDNRKQIGRKLFMKQ